MEVSKYERTVRPPTVTYEAYVLKTPIYIALMAAITAFGVVCVQTLVQPVIGYPTAVFGAIGAIFMWSRDSGYTKYFGRVRETEEVTEHHETAVMQPSNIVIINGQHGAFTAVEPVNGAIYRLFYAALKSDERVKTLSWGKATEIANYPKTPESKAMYEHLVNALKGAELIGTTKTNGAWPIHEARLRASLQKLPLPSGGMV